jgi:putative membrane protein
VVEEAKILMAWWFFFPMAVVGGLALIVVVSSLIIWAIFSSGSNKATQSGQHDQSLSIVRERYARGEITKEQYDQLTRDLKAT